MIVSELGEEGEGIAREDAKVFVIPGAVAGDVIAVKKSEPRGRAERVTAFEVQEPSPDRCASFCKHMTCGGCALKEWTLQGAAQAKARRLQNAFSRAGVEVKIDAMVSNGALAYRHRVRLHAHGKSIGYLRQHSHDVLPFGDCPVLEKPFEEALRRATETLAKTNTCFGELDAVFGDGRLALQLVADKGDALAALRELVAKKLAHGAVLVAEKKSRRIGEPQVFRQHPSFSGAARFLLEPGVFSQANWAMNEKLIAHVLQKVPADARLVELHAGAGNFTLPLAQRQKVWASEIAEAAVMCARRNAEVHKVSPTLVVADDKSALAQAPEADVLLLDPPRAGAKFVAEHLARAPKFGRIVYVSCDPGSLARDAKILAPHYALSEVTPFDMFPGTPHVEAVAVFERT